MYIQTIPGNIRHPGNCLPSLRGQKRCKEAKNDVKLIAKTNSKIRGKIRRNGQSNFLVAVVIEFFPGMIQTYVIDNKAFHLNNRKDNKHFKEMVSIWTHI